MASVGAATSGRVARVGVAAMKGTRHGGQDALELDAAGAVGDRLFCLVDPSTQRVLRTVQNPSLVAVAARRDGVSLDVTLPSGATAGGEPSDSGGSLTCDYWGRPVDLRLLDGPHSALFTSYLGFEVALAQAPRAEVIYGNPISIITTASLRELASHVGAGPAGLDPARFRATVVVDLGEVPFSEEELVGRELALGDARVRVAARIPRCAVIDLDPGTGERNGGLMRALGRLRPDSGPEGPIFGVDAQVTAPGMVRPGDTVELLDG